MSQTNNLIFVIYDSVFNSVFQSQVLTPILDRIKENKNLQVTLISFEKKKVSKKQISKIIPSNKNLKFIQAIKLPFLGKLSLHPAIWQLKKIFKKINTLQIITRGPLAGFIAFKSLPQNTKITIQARGLCAEELRFAHQNAKQDLLKNLVYKFRFNGLKRIEKQVYGANKTNLIIEAVSPALKNYLIKNFGADPNQITIASKDIPKKIDPEQIKLWKVQVRKKLNIPRNYYVYVYSGSHKPWQCPRKTIEYFKKEFDKNPNSYLLILTQDKEEFEKTIEQFNIDKSNYVVINVPANQIYKYLSAADAGFLLRQKDIVNWTSRPTKMLEYQSVGLKTVHNNSIELLNNNQYLIKLHQNSQNQYLNLHKTL